MKVRTKCNSLRKLLSLTSSPSVLSACYLGILQRGRDAIESSRDGAARHLSAVRHAPPPSKDVRAPGTDRVTPSSFCGEKQWAQRFTMEANLHFQALRRTCFGLWFSGVCLVGYPLVASSLQPLPHSSTTKTKSGPAFMAAHSAFLAEMYPHKEGREMRRNGATCGASRCRPSRVPESILIVPCPCGSEIPPHTSKVNFRSRVRRFKADFFVLARGLVHTEEIGGNQREQDRAKAQKKAAANAKKPKESASSLAKRKEADAEALKAKQAKKAEEAAKAGGGGK
ncbi:hypothetical protein CYLTODRAFT_414497 [Cylindrobasidium torrendii FP15055 ss-10]|uniref:Small EDRK-rich factor-like N-terminal domain-containing protein n=1 Tax=Cylindrobasidium torrendii FP15055 ss-10 TaxID=1314674 RepID=A0A0D7AXT6_9AGAR|nr:hypothetical protein CYLTODRAFT_414497 [Cylindrobasidium torrendii FP15055 ss-10]